MAKAPSTLVSDSLLRDWGLHVTNPTAQIRLLTVSKSSVTATDNQLHYYVVGMEFVSWVSTRAVNSSGS